MSKNNNKWYHFGKWVNNVLSHSFFAEIIQTEVINNLNFNFLKVIKILDNNYFFLKEDLKRIDNFIADKMVNDIEWFDKLFRSCDKTIQNLLSLKEKKDVEILFKTFRGYVN